MIALNCVEAKAATGAEKRQEARFERVMHEVRFSLGERRGWAAFRRPADTDLRGASGAGQVAWSGSEMAESGAAIGSWGEAGKPKKTASQLIRDHGVVDLAVSC